MRKIYPTRVAHFCFLGGLSTAEEVRFAPSADTSMVCVDAASIHGEALTVESVNSELSTLQTSVAELASDTQGMQKRFEDLITALNGMNENLGGHSNSLAGELIRINNQTAWLLNTFLPDHFQYHANFERFHAELMDAFKQALDEATL